MRRVYVASSWRNLYQPRIVEVIRDAGHEVYDFRHPASDDDGFHWSEIDPDWQRWTPQEYVAALDHPVAVGGFKSDFDAMGWADTFVLVLPCGRSAHLEAGWATGVGKPTCIVMLNPEEPELMYRMADRVVTSEGEMLSWLAALDQEGTDV